MDWCLTLRTQVHSALLTTEISYKKEKHFQIYFKHKHDFVVQPDESLLTIEEENSDVRRKIFKESCWWQQEDKKV